VAGAPAALRTSGPVLSVRGEEAMKREIAARGPIVCVLNFYKKPNGGLAAWTLAGTTSVFGGPSANLTSPSFISRPADDGEAYTRSFDAGAHAVVVHGFGTRADGVRYWDVRNSWGSRWGVRGDSKIERGVDAWNIETYCYASSLVP
jgi:hypothetical protein